jgi:uncharacterized DUF497 family protein
MIKAHFDWDRNKDLENQLKHGSALRKLNTLSQTPGVSSLKI